MKVTLNALAALLATTAAVAQAPNGYIVTAETWSQLVGGDGVVFVDPKTKIADRVSWANPSTWNGSHPMVALDDANPHIYTNAGAGIGGAPILQYVMQANRIQSMGPVSGAKPFGSVKRMHVFAAGKKVLFTINTVSPGLWSRNLTGSPVRNKQEANITDAFDVTVLGNMVYVSTYKSGNPSKIFAVDILNGRPPVELKLNLGSLTIAPFQAMDADPFLKMLIVGDDNGDLFRVNPSNGAVAKVNSTKGRGKVIALAAADIVAVAYVTDGKSVYDVRGWSSTTAQPVYSAGKETINDVAFSRWTRGGVIHYGKACPGTGGRTPQMLFGGYPTRGNKSLAVKMAGGPNNAKALLFLGLSRQKWGTRTLPLSLDFMGSVGCNLYVSADIVLGLTADGGGAISFQGAVPTSASLVGVHMMAQFGLADKGANPANTTASDAIEMVIQ
ncbi:MAG: hypothetical protein ACYTGW_21030 [Planctomycetota bacterium]|jgi:hypothetical protein